MKKERRLGFSLLENIGKSLVLIIILAMLMLPASICLDNIKQSFKLIGKSVQAQSINLTPIIKKLSTNVAKAEGGQKVVISGKNFSPDTQLILGSEKIDSTVKNESRIEFQVPPRNISGALTLSVINKNGIAQCQFNLIPKDFSELKNGEITTFLGGAVYFGDGLSALSDKVLINPSDVTIDDKGNIFFPDTFNHRVRRIDALTGIITTVAGNGNVGFSGDGSLAITASLNSPSKVIVDKDGNLFISDEANNRVRKVDTNNIITTIAGNGNSDFIDPLQDNVLAVNASVPSPKGLALDSKGNLFIINRQIISKVDPITQIITTVAGSKDTLGWSGDNGPANQALFDFPKQIIVDAQDNFIISDRGSSRIRRIDSATGIITSIVGGEMTDNDEVPTSMAGLISPNGIALDDKGNLFIVEEFGYRSRKADFSTSTITIIAGNGKSDFAGDGALAINASFRRPLGVAIDKNGNLLIADPTSKRLRKVDLETNLISTIAGNEQLEFVKAGDPLSSASLLFPSGLAIDTENNIFFSDKSNRVGKLDIKTKTISIIAGTGVTGFSGDGEIATNAKLSDSIKIALDKENQVFVIDRLNNRIRKITSSSNIITTIAGSGRDGFVNDGVEATNSRLGFPSGISIDNQGNLFIADTINNKVRKVDASKIISTVAGNGTSNFTGDEILAIASSLNRPISVVIDNSGNLLIADTLNNRIRKVNASRVITTIAGGGQISDIGDGSLAIRASLSRPTSMVVDKNGDIYFSDSGNNRIRKIDSITGIITSVVGNGEVGLSGDGALAKDAKLNIPEDLAIDDDGNLFFVDTLNHRVRVVKGIAIGRNPKPPLPMITAVKYEDPLLTISGSGFGETGATVFINKFDLSSRIGKQEANTIFLLGDRQKLKFRKSKNKITVKTSLGSSNTFIFTLD
ncbi:MAG: IPT/TIG domain-containing protein [Blastocatellia bacterium]|nr:IPT/TIG domain-containing protein [Blastocatellia bacterium]